MANENAMEEEIRNPIDLSAPPAEKAQELHGLSRQNEPTLQQAIAQIDSVLGTRSKTSRKSLDNILAKSIRPSILKEKPWFGVEHIRDALRFKTAMDHFDQAPKIRDMLVSRQFEIIKLDTSKMVHPREWGWRFWGLDLRIPQGQLVEFYSPLRELDSPEVKDANHDLFAKWRGKSSEEINQTRESVREYRRDVMARWDRYDQAYQASLVRMGFHERNGTTVEPDEVRAAEHWRTVEHALQNLTA